MTLGAVVDVLGLERLTPELRPAEGEVVTGAHASDLLSDVLANAPRGGICLTIQAHLNVVAVALHAELRAVIFTAGSRPDEATLDRARREGMPLYVTSRSTFDTAGLLYAEGLRGGHG